MKKKKKEKNTMTFDDIYLLWVYTQMQILILCLIFILCIFKW